METTDGIVIDRTVARHVLWFFGDSRGYEPGGFIGALLEAYSKADRFNRGKLGMVYPDYAKAFEVGQNTGGGIDVLVERATA